MQTSDDVAKLVRYTANAFPDEASGETAGSVEEVQAASRKIVQSVILALTEPGDEIRGYLREAAENSDVLDTEGTFKHVFKRLLERFQERTVVEVISR